MKTLSHALIAKKGTMKDIKNCLLCNSANLTPINFSANECLDCGFQQATQLPEYRRLEPKVLRRL